MTTRAAITTALLLALSRPAWWLLALAGFLIRGGIVAFLLAIVTIPSPLVLSNIVGPYIVPLAFGTLLPETAVLFGAVAGIGVAWLTLGGWFAAATEVVLIREAIEAADDEDGALGAGATLPDRRPGRVLSGRVALAHVLAHVPTAVAGAFGATAVVVATYAELVTPTDASPIPIRVIGRAILPIAVVVALWLAGEIVGGMAARRIVIHGASIPRALGRGIADLVRHPGGGLIAPLALTLVLGLDLAAVLAIVAVVLSDVQDRLAGALGDPVAITLVIATLGAAWALALVVTGLIASWRGAAMTLEHVRRTAAQQGRNDVEGAGPALGRDIPGRDNRGIPAPPTGG
jgi:hypothetical protein